MKNKKFYTTLGVLLVVAGGLLFVLQNCGKKYADTAAGRSGSSGRSGTNMVDDGYAQIERLARPAVNEGLIITNSKLLAFNSIPPTFDLKTDNTAVLEVLQEAATALGVVDALDGKLDFAAGFDSAVVGGFYQMWCVSTPRKVFLQGRPLIMGRLSLSTENLPY